MEKISFFGQFDPLPKCHLTMPTVARITAHRVPLNLGFLKSVSRRLYSPRDPVLQVAALDFVIAGIAKAAHGAPRTKFTCSMLIERVGERCGDCVWSYKT